MRFHTFAAVAASALVLFATGCGSSDPGTATETTTESNAGSTADNSASAPASVDEPQVVDSASTGLSPVANLDLEFDQTQMGSDHPGYQDAPVNTAQKPGPTVLK